MPYRERHINAHGGCLTNCFPLAQPNIRINPPDWSLSPVTGFNRSIIRFRSAPTRPPNSPVTLHHFIRLLRTAPESGPQHVVRERRVLPAMATLGVSDGDGKHLQLQHGWSKPSLFQLLDSNGWNSTSWTSEAFLNLLHRTQTPKKQPAALV